MTAPKASSAKKKTTEPKTPAAKRSTPAKSSAKWVRNLKNMPVHLRMRALDAERPFFVNLKPRGENGDAERIPAQATETREFIDAVQHGLIEIVTQTEINNVAYPPVGYLHSTYQVVRESDRQLASAPDWDGKGRPPQNSPVAAERPIASRFTPEGAPQVVDVLAIQGADAHQKQIADDRKVSADDMLPAGATIFEDKPGNRVDPSSRQVIIERVRRS